MKPMNLQVTKKFYKKIRCFFFPENNETRSYPASVNSNVHSLTRANSDESNSDVQSTTGTTFSARSKLIAKIRRNPPRNKIEKFFKMYIYQVLDLVYVFSFCFPSISNLEIQ